MKLQRLETVMVSLIMHGLQVGLRTLIAIIHSLRVLSFFSFLFLVIVLSFNVA